MEFGWGGAKPMHEWAYVYIDTYICIDRYEDSLRQAGHVDTHIYTHVHIHTHASAEYESWIYVFHPPYLMTIALSCKRAHTRIYM